VLLKLAATVTSYSSGGAGGIFAPVALHGRMLGGAVATSMWRSFIIGRLDRGLCGGGHGRGFCRNRSRPMTSVLIIFEMTNGYGLILPLMIANMSAFAWPGTGSHIGL